MLSVYQHWDPLEVCAVGRSYPPEFYSFIKNTKARSVMERIAIETEEDYQKLIKLLESFNVKVVRNDISDNRDDHFWAGYYSPPPMTPRDHTAMIGETFFMPGSDFGSICGIWDQLNYFCEDLNKFPKISDENWVSLTLKEKENFLQKVNDVIRTRPVYEKKRIYSFLKDRFQNINHNPLGTFPNNKKFNTFSSIENYVKQNGNKVIYDEYICGSVLTRVGKDLYYGDPLPNNNEENIVKLTKKFSHLKQKYLKDHRLHFINVETHSDAFYCPVKPGLILSLAGNQSYSQTFPDWEVVYLKGESWDKVKKWESLKKKNAGKWWVPGEELNDDFTDFVETWLNDWVLYVEETVFDVNMLVIDEHNVICNNYNKKAFDAFERHNITPHILNFRHRYFWDGGISCITSELSRKGSMKDYFPERNKT